MNIVPLVNMLLVLPLATPPSPPPLASCCTHLLVTKDSCSFKGGQILSAGCDEHLLTVTNAEIIQMFHE